MFCIVYAYKYNHFYSVLCVSMRQNMLITCLFFLLVNFRHSMFVWCNTCDLAVVVLFLFYARYACQAMDYAALTKIEMEAQYNSVMGRDSWLDSSSKVLGALKPIGNQVWKFELNIVIVFQVLGCVIYVAAIFMVNQGLDNLQSHSECLMKVAHLTNVLHCLS